MCKRLLTALLAAALLCSTALAAPIAANFLDSAALIDEDGAVIVAPGAYDFIFALDDASELFCGGSNEGGAYRYALLSGAGEPLSEQIYDMLALEDGVVVFTQDGLYGAMTTGGEVLAEAAYTQLVSNGEGGFLALTTDCFDDQSDGLYRIDETGAVSATGVQTLGTLNWFSDGLMPLISAENNLYGYVDASGQWAIRPQFAYAGPFIEGRALASLTTGYGLIDNTGNWVLTPKYPDITFEDGELALAVEGDGSATGFDPATCAEIFRIEGGEGSYYAAYDGVVQAFDGEKTCLYDYSGRLIHEGGAQASYARGENGQFILSDGPWGAECYRIVRADGTLVEGAWQSLFPLFTLDGMGYYGFMAFEATPVYVEELDEEQYDWDPDGVRYGVVDENGETVLSARYEALSVAGEKRLLVREGDAQGLIDVHGNWIYQISTARE